MVLTCQSARQLAMYRVLQDILSEVFDESKAKKVFDDLFNNILLIRDTEPVLGLPYAAGNALGFFVHADDLVPHPLAYFIKLTQYYPGSQCGITPGDMVCFNNVDDYLMKHPFGSGRRIAAVYTGEVDGKQKFCSFPEGLDHTEFNYKNYLAYSYNVSPGVGFFVDIKSRADVGYEARNLSAVDIPGLDTLNGMAFDVSPITRLIQDPDTEVRFFHDAISGFEG